MISATNRLRLVIKEIWHLGNQFGQESAKFSEAGLTVAVEGRGHYQDSITRLHEVC